MIRLSSSLHVSFVTPKDELDYTLLGHLLLLEVLEQIIPFIEDFEGLRRQSLLLCVAYLFDRDVLLDIDEPCSNYILVLQTDLV